MDAGLTGLLRPLQATASAVAPKAGEAIAAPAESVEARARKRRVQDEDPEHERQRRRRSQAAPVEPPDDVVPPPAPTPGLFIDPAMSEHVETAPGSAVGMRAYREKLAGEAASVNHRVEKLA